MARKMGFDEGVRQGRHRGNRGGRKPGATAVAESAAAVQSGDCAGLEVIAIDRGRGIPNIEKVCVTATLHLGQGQGLARSPGCPDLMISIPTPEKGLRFSRVFGFPKNSARSLPLK